MLEWVEWWWHWTNSSVTTWNFLISSVTAYCSRKDYWISSMNEESQLLFCCTGDELLAVNGQVCHDLTHSEAVALFKKIKSGPVALHICRRIRTKDSWVLVTVECEANHSLPWCETTIIMANRNLLVLILLREPLATFHFTKTVPSALMVLQTPVGECRNTTSPQSFSNSQHMTIPYHSAIYNLQTNDEVRKPCHQEPLLQDKCRWGCPQCSYFYISNIISITSFLVADQRKPSLAPIWFREWGPKSDIPHSWQGYLLNLMIMSGWLLRIITQYKMEFTISLCEDMLPEMGCQT